MGPPAYSAHPAHQPEELHTLPPRTQFVCTSGFDPKRAFRELVKFDVHPRQVPHSSSLEVQCLSGKRFMQQSHLAAND